MSLYFVQKLQPTREAVRNVAKKAIMCEESNTRKHSSPNIITGAGNFPRYFVLKPSLGQPVSMGSSELQWVLHQPHACLLELGFANEYSRHSFSTFSPHLSPHHLAVHHQSHGGSSLTPALPSPLYSALSFYPDALSKLSQPEIKLYVEFFTLLAVLKLKHLVTSV